MLLLLSDVPAGWTSYSPRAVDVGPNAGPAGGLTACLHSDAGLFRHDRPGHVFVSSHVYQSPEYIALIENLDVAPDTAAAEGDFAVLAKPDFPACLGQAYGAVLSGELVAQGYHNPTVAATNAAPLAVPAVGDRSSAFRVSDTIVVSGQPQYVYTDVILFQEGRTTGMLQFERVFSAVPGDLEQQLTAKAANRVTSVH
jgi:hypothetical protein